jgi:hypothetical protein
VILLLSSFHLCASPDMPRCCALHFCHVAASSMQVFLRTAMHQCVKSSPRRDALQSHAALVHSSSAAEAGGEATNPPAAPRALLLLADISGKNIGGAAMSALQWSSSRAAALSSMLSFAAASCLEELATLWSHHWLATAGHNRGMHIRQHMPPEGFCCVAQ